MHALLKCILIIKYIPNKHSLSVLNKPRLSSPVRANAAFENTAEPLFLYLPRYIHINTAVFSQLGLIPLNVYKLHNIENI